MKQDKYIASALSCSGSPSWPRIASWHPGCGSWATRACVCVHTAGCGSVLFIYET